MAWLSHEVKFDSVRTKTGWTTWIERTLYLAGAVGLLYCGLQGSRMLAARRVANAIVPVRAESQPDGTEGLAGFVDPSASGVDGTSRGQRPTVVGRVEIPAIGLVTPLMDGDDSMSLAEGAGHIPGTAVPGGLGTVGIAGHRDTHFRQLGKVQVGMDVRLVSRAGIFHYRVTSFEIVTPEQVSVLAIGDVPSLALVTCYPFQFIGHAPKRFIVHAELVSVAADVAAAPASIGR